jgi:PAS domain-containing protein
MVPFLIFLVILGLSVGLLSSWRQNRKLLAQARNPSDTTEHKRAEEERHALSHDLQESKARLEQAQRVAHMGHYYWDLIANRVTWSDELYRIYGLTPREGPIDMAMVREMMHPDDRGHVFSAVEEAVRDGVHWEARCIGAAVIWSIRPGRTTRCGKGLRENHKGTIPRRQARTT